MYRFLVLRKVQVKVKAHSVASPAVCSIIMFSGACQATQRSAKSRLSTNHRRRRCCAAAHSRQCQLTVRHDEPERTTPAGACGRIPRAHV